MKKVILILAVVFLMCSINASDIETIIGSGGDDELIIGSIGDDESFFSGEEAPVTGGDEEEPGGGGSVTPSKNYEVSPLEFNINLAINTTTERKITLKNLGSSTITLDIREDGLGNHITFEEDSISLNPGETKEFDVVFIALKEEGVFTGRIIINGTYIPVSLNVVEELLLFDSNILVLNPGYEVPFGTELETLITLIPMAGDPRLDVQINYDITDERGNSRIKRTETLLVEEQMSFERTFDTTKLPVGKYNIALEVIYPNGIAPASAHFEIVERTIWSRGLTPELIFYFMVITLIIGLIIVTALILKRVRKGT